MTRLSEARRLGMANIFDGVEQNELAEALSSYLEQQLVEEIHSALPRRRCAMPDIFDGISGEEVREICQPADEVSSGLMTCLGDVGVEFDVARVLRTRRGAVSDVLENVTEMEHGNLKRMKGSALSRCLERSESVINYSYGRRGAISDI
ncbi:uncharacterized protein LOC128219362 [Mya arenaria]|uniref:uncharacterized protein LOC128219362 n=1 Tax=Mya arenaria TaxID=6604 RepID=UPI0022E1E8D3|nr:uncharacterized protein LOC128219362 [Mya arenaria]